MNTASTECSPQNEFVFDDMFSKPKEISPFNFLDEKVNYVEICKNALLFKYEENEINPHLKRELSYSDLNIYMKKEEVFNLNPLLKKEGITKDMILSYISTYFDKKRLFANHRRQTSQVQK